MQIMPVLFPSVTTVAIPVILLLSAPNLAMMKSARKLVKLEEHETLSKVEVVEDVEVEMAMEVVQVMGLVLMGSVLLETVQYKATLLE